MEDPENKIRKFHFAIDKIYISFEMKIEKCFVEFEIGGQSIEDETEYVCVFAESWGMCFAHACPRDCVHCVCFGNSFPFFVDCARHQSDEAIPEASEGFLVHGVLRMRGCVYVFVFAFSPTDAAHRREYIEKPKMKKMKKPDGTIEEKEIMEAVTLKQIRVKKTPTLRYFSYVKPAIKAKTEGETLMRTFLLRYCSQCRVRGEMDLARDASASHFAYSPSAFRPCPLSSFFSFDLVCVCVLFIYFFFFPPHGTQRSSSTTAWRARGRARTTT